MTHKWTRPLLFEEPRVLKYEELGPKPDQRFYPQIILEVKPRVFSSLNNAMELGLGVLSTTLVRTKDLKVGHFKNEVQRLPLALGVGLSFPK
jgi:hypothetical protein